MSELENNDHRKIGQELDLFVFSDLVGPGLPLWTPKGTIVYRELDNFVWELREKAGYERVTIPHITKRSLYDTSGHWEKFATDLFKITSREGKEYALKPMNCPHHTQIFARKPHSYRDMPQRYAETTMVYRDEQSGELGGLTRVLSITQDDAHVFCRINQVKEEFLKIWDIVDVFYKTFGFSLKVRLSFRDPKTPEKYLGTQDIWDKAENELREIATERGADAFEGLGEAALYGPKLDFMATNSAGREWQVATIQLDMNLPERFDLSCINEKGEKERIVMIHAAITGSIERCTAVLLEHTGGKFPTWLSPVQVKILPIGEGHFIYATAVMNKLKAENIRVELDISDETLGKKIRNAKTEKVPYALVIGDKEVENKNVTVESRDSGNLGQSSIEDLVSKLKEEIKERK
ncbi:MAG: threonine--tRNA ligase [bacterium]|nr:threonine--tRNA ligase [bacterium]